MKAIKVSVIVPVYNVAKYLAKCLDSLVNQTLQEIEIIVVNDGSPDHSQSIIDDYAKRYPDKIRPFLKENGGLSDARNYGIARASGEYIGFVDSDDYVDLDMYEKMHQKASATGAEVVCCSLCHEYTNKTIKTFYNDSFFGTSALENPKLLVYANSVAVNKIYHREFWQKHQFAFPLKQWFEDSYLIYNVMLTANKVECVNLPFMHYVRDREDSITNRFDMRLFDILKSTESIVSYAKKFGAFKDIKEELQYICLRHLTARVMHLRKCPEHTESRRFIHEMVTFLNREFPDWRKSRYLKPKKDISLHAKFSKWMLQSEQLMCLYVSMPQWLVVVLRSVLKAQRELAKSLKRPSPGKQSLKAQKKKEQNCKYLQKNGIAVLHKTQELLREIDITSFADFGTCLGLVREGRLLANDLDINIGVIATSQDKEKIRIALERQGFKLWRQYQHQDKIIQESFRYRQVKVDLNFYEITDTYARTWLFYKKPGHVYKNSWTYHVVQMTCSPIKCIKYQEFDGHRIAMPENPELLMAEKYGSNWQTPDTEWNICKSPAAEVLEEPGHFKKCIYSTSKQGKQLKSSALTPEMQLERFRTLQLQQVEILKELKRVCQALGITYYLGEGTLLGAIRHQGFVPWEQNATIWMDRLQYNHFIREAASVLSNRFVLQYGSVFKTYFTPCAKLRLLDKSLFCDKRAMEYTEDCGPCIDVLPLEPIATNDLKVLANAKKQYKSYKTQLQFKHHCKKIKTWKHRLTKLRSCLTSTEFLLKRLNTVCQSHATQENPYYICLASSRKVQTQIFEASMFQKPRYALFENDEFPIPNNAEEILQQIYNNYQRVTPTYLHTLKSHYVYVPDEVATKEQKSKKTNTDE